MKVKVSLEDFADDTLARLSNLEKNAVNIEHVLKEHQNDIDRLSRENNELRQTVASIEHHVGLDKAMSDPHMLDPEPFKISMSPERLTEIMGNHKAQSDLLTGVKASHDEILPQEDVIKKLSSQVSQCQQRVRNLETELDALRDFKKRCSGGVLQRIDQTCQVSADDSLLLGDIVQNLKDLDKKPAPVVGIYGDDAAEDAIKALTAQVGQCRLQVSELETELDELRDFKERCRKTLPKLGDTDVSGVARRLYLSSLINYLRDLDQ